MDFRFTRDPPEARAFDAFYLPNEPSVKGSYHDQLEWVLLDQSLALRLRGQLVLFGGILRFQGTDPVAIHYATYCWMAAIRSPAVSALSSNSSTCSLVPLSGSRVGTRWSASAPLSKMSESQDAAAIESMYL